MTRIKLCLLYAKKAGEASASPKSKNSTPKGNKDMNNEKEKTQTFRVRNEKDTEMKRTLKTVYDALVEKGYNPINQIVGYLLSEDPTYITNHNSARTLIRKLDRDEILNTIVAHYLGV